MTSYSNPPAWGVCTSCGRTVKLRGGYTLIGKVCSGCNKGTLTLSTEPPVRPKLSDSVSRILAARLRGPGGGDP